jgi:hypothetical protein
VNDAEFDALRNRIQGLFEKWRWVLGLNTWDIQWNYFRTFEPGTDPEASFTYIMKAEMDWRYRNGMISVYTPALEDSTDSELERKVVHELLHFMVNELRDRGKENDALDHEERVVTDLAFAITQVKKHAEEGYFNGDDEPQDDPGGVPGDVPEAARPDGEGSSGVGYYVRALRLRSQLLPWLGRGQQSKRRR